MLCLIRFLSDACIIFVELFIFTRLISLKRDCMKDKIIMYLGCTAIIFAYFVFAYLLQCKTVYISVFCMGIPSFLLFYYLSGYKGSRLILTFCLVDSSSLVVAFIADCIGFLSPFYKEEVSLIVMVGLFTLIYVKGKSYFKRYHDLLEATSAGWQGMAIATAAIYFALVFLSCYPEPLYKRKEYIPVYLVFTLVVITCYFVFFQSIIMIRKIHEQNQVLEQENEIYKIAYRDALTGLYNRAAYGETVNELKQKRSNGDKLYCLMCDLNNFKAINDTLGHHAGDSALKTVAQSLKKVFNEEGEYIFRPGGDEFSVILSNTSEMAVKAKIKSLEKLLDEESRKGELQISIAVGYDYLRPEPEDTIEKTLIRADEKMYVDKRRQKGSA